jgi:hypothetical protein
MSARKAACLFAGLIGWLFPVASFGAEPVTAVPVGVVPYAISAADLNGDRRVELIAGGLDRDEIRAVTASGVPRWRYATQGMPLALAAGDVNGDGAAEIVAVIGTSASQIVVLKSDGTLLREFTPDAPVYFLRLADFDNDRRADIVVVGYMGKVLVYNAQGSKILDKTVCEHNFYRQMAGLATGDVDGDGRADIAYHGGLQLPGILNARGENIARWLLALPAIGMRLTDGADIDGDGKMELLLCDVGGVRAEALSKKLWSTGLKQSAPELTAEADGNFKLPWEYGSIRTLVAGNFTADPGLEIASITSDGKFNLLSSAGKELLRTKTRYPFLNVAAADVDGDGFDEALLGRLHYKNVYVVKFAPSADAAGAALREIMATDGVTAHLDAMLNQIDAVKQTRVRARSHGEKLHVLWGVEATLVPTLIRPTIVAFDKKMRELRNDNVEYAFMFTLKERGVDKYKHDGICAVGPLAPSGEKLLEQCREWEQLGVRFYPVVSHMGVPTVMPETAKRIMEVAPNACQGYLTWETMGNYPGEVWYDFLHRMDELAKICVEKRKKILFAEEAPFWLALVSDPKARAILLKPEYKGVLVPVLKTLTPQTDETDISAYVGSMLAGEIDTWGITAEEDFWPLLLGHYRGCPDDVVMRQGMMAMSLGARYLMIESGHVYFDPLNAQGQVVFMGPVDCRISREARREHLVVELFRKGIMGPVAPGDLLGVSPVGIAMSRSPRLDRAPMRWAAFGTRTFDGDGLVGLDFLEGVYNSGRYSIARNLYGAKKLMNGVFPLTPWGIVPIFGPPPAAQNAKGIATVFASDWEFILRGREKLPAREGMPQLVAAVRAAAERLAFRADGVFLSARRDGENRYQVLLMDPEMFAPVDIATVLTTTIPNLRCRDAITGEPLAATGNGFKVTVPAGAWRLLDFEPGR